MTTTRDDGSPAEDVLVTMRPWTHIADQVGPLRVLVWLPRAAPDAPGRKLKTLIEPPDTAPNSVHFVATHRGQTAGAVRLTMDYLPKSTLDRANGTLPNGNCYISRLVVHPDHQGRGIGMKLVAACAEHAKQQGQNAVWIETAPLARSLVKHGFAYVNEYTEETATFVPEHVTILRKGLD